MGVRSSGLTAPPGRDEPSVLGDSEQRSAGGAVDERTQVARRAPYVPCRLPARSIGRGMANRGTQEQKIARAMGWGLVLCGIVVAAYQALGWLQYGRWSPFDLRNLTNPMTAVADTGWFGVDEILRWLGRRSVSGISVFLGVILIYDSSQ